MDDAGFFAGNSGKVPVVLWDFGDTLVDERFARVCRTGVPEWSEMLEAFAATELARRWAVGEVTFGDVAAYLAEGLPMSAAAVRQHLIRCCEQLEFRPRTWAVAQSRLCTQALVTVNPDALSEVIVPAYGFGSVFDVIVTSWEARTDEKAALCDLALAQLGNESSRGSALLIDNIEANVAAWRARGGLGYHYRGDDEFADRFTSLGWDAFASSDADHAK